MTRASLRRAAAKEPPSQSGAKSSRPTPYKLLLEVGGAAGAIATILALVFAFLPGQQPGEKPVASATVTLPTKSGDLPVTIKGPTTKPSDRRKYLVDHKLPESGSDSELAKDGVGVDFEVVVPGAHDILELIGVLTLLRSDATIEQTLQVRFLVDPVVGCQGCTGWLQLKRGGAYQVKIEVWDQDSAGVKTLQWLVSKIFTI